MSQQFYFVDCLSPRATTVFAWAYVPESGLRRIECPKNQEHNRYTYIRPIPIGWTVSRNLADFTPANYAIIVTERVRDSFVKAGFRGFRYHPVNCVEYEPAFRPDRTHEVSDQAFAPEELQGKLWELWADLELKFAPNCGRQVKFVCDVCGLREFTPLMGVPLRLDLSNWNGEDAVNLFGEALYVSERVVRFVEKEGFTGVGFVSIEDFGQPLPGTRVLEEFLPGLTERIQQILSGANSDNRT